MRIMLFLLGLGLLFPAFSDSLWNENSLSLYSNQRPFQIGDLITVMIVEQSSASNAGDTRTNKKEDLSAGYDFQVPGYTTAKGSLGFNGDNKYQGKGLTTRQSSFKAKITAQVLEIKPNGDLYVVGKRVTRINDETEVVQISGIVRLADIQPGNVVLSSQIAQAQISVTGKGTVSDPQQPGLMSRIFGWLF